MKWYKGPTLLEAFDSLVPPKRPLDKPLRLPVQSVFKISGIGTVPSGRVETGILKVGQNIAFPSFGKKLNGIVKSIEMHHESMKEATPGDVVGFNVSGISAADISKGIK
jgi:elongation factor 1-alpha